MTKDEILKELEVLDKKLDEAVEWNFGYDPNEKYFHDWLDRHAELRTMLRTIDQTAYDEYITRRDKS